MADRRITAVILEDHPAVVEGVRNWLSAADPPIELIDAGTRVNHVWTPPGGDADVVIFDLGLREQGMHEFDALERLVERGRKVVVHSAVVDPKVILRCGDIGVKAYVTKVEAREHLVPAVLAAANGDTYTAPRHGGALLANLSERSDRPGLTPREIEVTKAYCSYPAPAVAARLGIALGTVRTHIERVRKKYEDVGRPAYTQAHLGINLYMDGFVDADDLERSEAERQATTSGNREADPHLGHAASQGRRRGGPFSRTGRRGG